MEKLFVTAEELLRDSFELATQIYESGYRPSYIVGVWRGGTPVGIAVQEVLELLGCPTNHFAIRTSSYGGGMVQAKEVKVIGLQHLVETINVDDQLLIIDDIFDSGRSVDAIIEALREKCRRNTPEDIRVATVYYKPKRNATTRVPDFYVHETDEWTVFPHELQGCTLEELKGTKTLPARIFDMLPDDLG
ncbi:MAG: phosphoribosyltransferase [Maricaulaceae bacterium]